MVVPMGWRGPSNTHIKVYELYGGLMDHLHPKGWNHHLPYEKFWFSKAKTFVKDAALMIWRREVSELETLATKM